MSISVHDYLDVAAKAAELGCNAPTSWAVLPRNFVTATTRSELIHESNAATVRTLLRNAGLQETRIEQTGEKYPQVQENSFTWVGPIIFFAASQIAQNPDLISLALGVVSNYLTDFFRGMPDDSRVTLDIVIEQTPKKKHVRVHYEGDAAGVAELSNTVKELWHNEG